MLVGIHQPLLSDSKGHKQRSCEGDRAQGAVFMVFGVIAVGRAVALWLL